MVAWLRVDFNLLGEQFELSGGSIKSAVFRAAVEVPLVYILLMT